MNIRNFIEDFGEPDEDCLSVNDLINILKKFPPQMKVMITWESTIHSLEEENIYVSWRDTLLIDGDCNTYKDDFQKGNEK